MQQLWYYDIDLFYKLVALQKINHNLVIVHYWFYVRGAENLCKLREEMVEAKIR